MNTGYPVVMVMIITGMQAVTTFGIKVLNDNKFFGACIMTGRNNEMKYLIAKYFVTFFHELTVISALQSNAVDNGAMILKSNFS